MPVMKQLRIGSATYDTVGEASVTQVQTSGTKIATVTIDGTATDLYAPEGGGGGSTVTVTQTLASGTDIASISVDGTSTTLYAPTPPTVPSASSTTPSMDGTAAVGAATTYARADHVHPTDTSRAPASHSHGNISALGNIANSTAIESGDSLVIGHGQNYNVIRSTLAFGSDTATFLRNDGTWAQPEGGGGGGGGGDAYVIGMTLNGTTVSDVSYPTGESATTIAAAVVDDPSTRVVFAIDASSDDGILYCTPCSLQAAYNSTWGDIATSIRAVIPMWYESGGDRETYLLRLVYTNSTWYAYTRTTL